MDSGKKGFKNRHWWFWTAGFFAFLWVLLRSGTNPKRLTYPCQQMAFPLASTWFLAVIAVLGGGLFLKRFAKLSAVSILLVGVMFLGASPGLAGAKKAPSSLPTWEVSDPVSTVFVMDSIPSTSGSLATGDASVPDHYLKDPAVDTLLAMLAAKDIFLHRTAEHPQGIVGADNVVIIKANFQWNAQNGTNSDRIKGLIWQILNHPDGFSGEILVCDNTQQIGTGINDQDNNGDDPEQSIVDVVATFKAKGYPVDTLDWKYIWDDVASEYSEGDYNDGYVYETDTKISYPKFRSPSGNHYISLRYGIWDSDAESYDAEKLCIIDFPVLKAHFLAGSTIAVKNWIGVLTTAYAQQRYGGSNAMHYNYFFSDYALVARVMAVTWPRLTIVDATWTSGEGPNNLNYLTNTKMLLASTDPVASSWYAAKFILTPVAKDPDETDPDRQGSLYNNHLGRWTTFLADSAGLACSMDSTEISVYDRSVLIPSGVTERESQFLGFQLKVTGVTDQGGTISYVIAKESRTNLVILDTSGRLVKTLVDGVSPAGQYSVRWGGTDDLGRRVSAGTYLCRIQAGGFTSTQKILLVK